jgi:protein TonB
MADSVLDTSSPYSEPETKSAQAFGLALLIEAAIIVGLIGLMAVSASTQAGHTEPVPLTLLADDTPKPEQPQPEPKPQKIKPISREMPKVPTPPHAALISPATPPLAAMESDVQTAFADPAPAPPPPPLPAPSNAHFEQDYAGKVHDAVQSAYFYPPAAAAMRFSGRVRVEFMLRDTQVVESRVVQSCGIGLFDRAAIDAVKVARYPDPPAELRGQSLHYQIWVELSTRG